ncbi:MAG: thioesterase domain-containing protein [Gammaproteobacteria bacterium]|nr:thioesterase domain-containing protein [Gammaproteobacteria bacterium]
MDTCNYLQSVLHREIPLTIAMGIKVTDCTQHRLELRAPLEPNINHKCTAFGGSLYSVAVLCGWGFVFHQMHLNKLTGHIVIQHSDADYKLPVGGEIRAVCEIGDETKLTRFFKTFKRKNIARIKLQIKILFNEEEAMLLTAHYVVHK